MKSTVSTTTKMTKKTTTLKNKTKATNWWSSQSSFESFLAVCAKIHWMFIVFEKNLFASIYLTYLQLLINQPLILLVVVF
jgi:hypothetical protein